jgi:hypothetical protein
MTQEINFIKDKLKKDFNIEYNGTDPIEDTIGIDVAKQSKIFLTESDISAKKVENFPFEEYGLGITAYFRLMKNLIYVLLIVSVLVLPTLVIYGGENGYKHSLDGIFLKSMLGNMG